MQVSGLELTETLENSASAHPRAWRSWEGPRACLSCAAVSPNPPQGTEHSLTHVSSLVHHRKNGRPLRHHVSQATFPGHFGHAAIAVDSGQIGQRATSERKKLGGPWEGLTIRPHEPFSSNHQHLQMAY